MEEKKYEVIVWKRDINGKYSCNTKWSGSDLSKGKLIAGHIYGMELLKEELKRRLNNNQFLFNILEENLKEEYFCDIKDRRVTLSERIESKDEARGQKKPLIESYGDESIEMFQRVHLS